MRFEVAVMGVSAQRMAVVSSPEMTTSAVSGFQGATHRRPWRSNAAALTAGVNPLSLCSFSPSLLKWCFQRPSPAYCWRLYSVTKKTLPWLSAQDMSYRVLVWRPLR